MKEWEKHLVKAQTKREKADYDIYYEPSKEESESLIEDAEKFLDRIARAMDELKG